MKQYYYCNAKQRPSICRVETNLCCMICQFIDDCYFTAREQKLKIKPCKPDFSETERCNYQI